LRVRKLDELIRVTQARNKMMGIEKLSDDELQAVKAEMGSGPA
jgi:low affinity Fe/Cu permease